MKQLAIRATAPLGALTLLLSMNQAHAAISLAPTSEAVSTSIGDAYPAQNWIADLYADVRPSEPAALDEDAGYQRLTLQSYCLQPGTYGPTRGDGYLLAPLKGAQANLIGRILARSVAYPTVEQSDIQRLIWGIEAQAHFDDFDADFQSLVRSLLTSDEIDALNATRIDKAQIGRELLGRVLPQAAKDVIDRYAELRTRVTDASVSYEELREIAVRSGIAPRGAGSRDVRPGTWGYAGDTTYVRFFPDGYSNTTVEILRPAPYDIVRDTLGRIVGLTGAGISVQATYAPGAAELVKLPDNSVVHIWRFASVKIQGPKPGQAATVAHQGWTLDSRDVYLWADGAHRRANASARTVLAYEPRVIADGLGARFFIGMGVDTYKRVSSAKGFYDNVMGVAGFTQRGAQATLKPTDQAFYDLTDLGHFTSGLTGVGGGPLGNAFWIADTLLRVRNLAAYAGCVIEGACPPPKERRPAKKGPIAGLISRLVAIPGNTLEQRLGLSARVGQIH